MKSCPLVRPVGRLVAVAIVAAVALVAVAGCFDPYRVRVAQGALDASPLEWNVTKSAIQGKTFGTKTTETRYVHESPDGSPPYPGVLQVFSIRGGDLRSTGDLTAFTRSVIEQAIEREGISIDGTQDSEGKRSLRNGETTSWFAHVGVISRSSPDSIFLPGGGQNIVVRILGEAGYDGTSKTSYVAVAFVQVGERTQSGLPGGIGNTQNADEQTWYEVVGDPTGSIGGASLPTGRGLIYNLRTHG